MEKQTRGKQKNSIKARLDVNFPSLLLHFHNPPHHHVANLTVIPKSEIKGELHVDDHLVLTGVTDISLFTLSTTPAKLAHNT